MKLNEYNNSIKTLKKALDYICKNYSNIASDLSYEINYNGDQLTAYIFVKYVNELIPTDIYNSITIWEGDDINHVIMDLVYKLANDGFIDISTLSIKKYELNID